MRINDLQRLVFELEVKKVQAVRVMMLRDVQYFRKLNV